MENTNNKTEYFYGLSSDISMENELLYTQDLSEEIAVILDTYSTYPKSEKYELYDKLYVDALIKKALNIPIDDSLSEWRIIDDDELDYHDKRLEIKDNIIQACKIARKYGESLVLPVLVNKTKTGFDKIPLNLSLDTVLLNYKNIEILKILIIDKFDSDENLESDIYKDHYGKPKWFKYDNGKRSVKIEPSRVIHISNNELNKSFIDSILNYFYHFMTRNNEVTRAVTEANWIILKTDFKMIQSEISARLNSTHNNISHRESLKIKTEEGIRNRLINMRANAHSSSSYAIDKTMEDIQQIKKDNIDQMSLAAENSLQLIAGAADVPMSRFLGRKVTGMGGSADTPNYIQFLYGFRSTFIESKLNKLDLFLKTIYKKIKVTDYEWKPIIIQQIEYSQDRTPLERATNIGGLQTG